MRTAGTGAVGHSSSVPLQTASASPGSLSAGKTPCYLGLAAYSALIFFLTFESLFAPGFSQFNFHQMCWLCVHSFHHSKDGVHTDYLRHSQGMSVPDVSSHFHHMKGYHF